MTNRSWLLMLLLASAVPAGAQQEQSLSYRPNLMLFTECAPVRLAVNVFDNDDPIGLTWDRVWVMAESRLRAARLYDNDTTSLGGAVRLYLYVSVFRNAYAYTGGIEIRMTHPYYEPGDGLLWTWSSFPETGLHGGDAGLIMRRLTERVDALIGDYLRVNAGNCR